MVANDSPPTALETRRSKQRRTHLHHDRSPCPGNQEEEVVVVVLGATIVTDVTALETISIATAMVTRDEEEDVSTTALETFSPISAAIWSYFPFFLCRKM